MTVRRYFRYFSVSAVSMRFHHHRRFLFCFVDRSKKIDETIRRYDWYFFPPNLFYITTRPETRDWPFLLLLRFSYSSFASSLSPPRKWSQPTDRERFRLETKRDERKHSEEERKTHARRGCFYKMTEAGVENWGYWKCIAYASGSPRNGGWQRAERIVIRNMGWRVLMSRAGSFDHFYPLRVCLSCLR